MDTEAKTIALAGNPNVGKSTVFNQLTGLNQHTGNWPGKTVTTAQGVCHFEDADYLLVDLPGTYSLLPHSQEEEVARDFLVFKKPDAVLLICDATCLERNLNLALQCLEITDKLVLGVNFMDEARKKKIGFNVSQLSACLGVPVIPICARRREGLDDLMRAVQEVTQKESTTTCVPVLYDKPIETAIARLKDSLKEKLGSQEGSLANVRWMSLRLLIQDQALQTELKPVLGYDLFSDPEISLVLDEVWEALRAEGVTQDGIEDNVVTTLVLTAEETAHCVREGLCTDPRARDRRIDRVLTGKRTALPMMLLLLSLILWITLTGANIPSDYIGRGLFWVQDRLLDFFAAIQAPIWLSEMLVLGVYRVLAWVVSVMLPPMAIFFPLFTLLEDMGYLPRVAFNLDRAFKKACACGKQALTMCMGFGCNAAGVVGARIIDSPRERLIAIITNCFVPCNGRFPTLIAIIAMFFAGTAVGGLSSVLSVLLLTAVIVFGVLVTFLMSRLLSKTLLKGVPSSFILELPPYRKPQIGKILVRSLLDRTLFVLGRAAAVAAPAGLLIWVMGNVTVGGSSLLTHCAGFLDPFARLLGLDGVILFAFILGFPANEIVVPIIIMAYMSTGTILELDALSQLKGLLVQNGWTWVTAVSMLLFCLMHWPCSTTCLTIRRETKSTKWTLVSFLIPTVMGVLTCFAFTTIARLLGAPG